MNKGTPTILYHELIMESSQTGIKISITQNDTGKFLARILETSIWNAFSSIKQAISWAEERLLDVSS